MNKVIYGTGSTKVRMFGGYRSITTLVLLMRLHLKEEEFKSVLQNIMANDFETIMGIVEEKIGSIYSFYLNEDIFLEDIADGREVLKIGADD